MQYNKLPYALVTASCSITSGREHLRSFSLALKKKKTARKLRSWPGRAESMGSRAATATSVLLGTRA